MREAVLILDHEQRVLAANQPLMELLGASDLLEGRRLRELGCAWNLEPLQKRLARTLHEGGAFTDFEVLCEAEEIGQRRLQVNGRRLDDGLILLTFVDPAAQSRESEHLLRSEARFRALAHTTTDLVCRLNADGTRIMEIFGRAEPEPDEPKEDLTWLLGYVHPDQRQAAFRAWRTSVQTQEPFAVELLVRRNEHSWSWMFVEAVPVRDDRGKVLEWIASATDISERKAREEALRRSEERYRNLFESIDEGFCLIELVYEADGRATDYVFLEANPAFERHTGFKNVLGRSIRDLVPSYKPEWLQAFDDVARTGTALRFQAHSEGMHRWFDVYAFAVAGQGRVAVVLNDITRRKAALDALRESEERFRLALEGSPITVYENDEELRYLWIANPTPPFKVEEVIGRTDAELVPDWSEELTAIKRRVMRTATPERRQLDGLIDGKERAFDLMVEPRLDESGRAVGVRAAFTDITAIRKAERAVRQSEERFRNLALHAPIMILETDAAGQCTYVNERWSQATAQSPEDALGSGWLQAVHPDDRQAFEEGFQAAGCGGDFVAREVRLGRPDGSYRWAAVGIAASSDDRQQVKGFICSILDIHAHWEMEESLRRAIAAKDEFLSLVSHELLTPLTIVRGNANLLVRGVPLTEEQRWQAIQDLAAEAERLNRLIQNMLVLGRLQTGRMPAVMNIEALQAVKDAVSRFRLERPQSHVTIDPAFDDVPVAAVGQYLEQIMQNLLTNAYKYSETGSEIEVSGLAEDGVLRVAVADRGIGIKDPEALFHAFYREAEAERRGSAGLGIGLTVCRRLVEAQGGTIQAKAREGGGTVVSFTLPLST